MIVTIAKIIFGVFTVALVVLTALAVWNPEISGQLKWVLIGTSLACVGNISNWRRYEKKENANDRNNTLEFRLNTDRGINDR